MVGSRALAWIGDSLSGIGWLLLYMGGGGNGSSAATLGAAPPLEDSPLA